MRKIPVAGRHLSGGTMTLAERKCDWQGMEFERTMPDSRQTTCGRLTILEVVADVLKSRKLCQMNPRTWNCDDCYFKKEDRALIKGCHEHHDRNKIWLALWFIDGRTK